MKKCITTGLVFLLVMMLSSCKGENAVLDVAKTYEIKSTVHSLDIEISAADFTIIYGDRFFVESNLKYLSVSEANGILRIADKTKSGVNYADAKLTLCLPQDIVFNSVEIATGAANLTADTLSANDLELELGAGNVEFGCLNAYKDAEIEGGAGKITVRDGTLNDLSLTLGMGKLELTAALPGESNLTLGVGEADLTLIGSQDDYTLDIEEGIGSITIDRSSGSGNIGIAQHRVEIEGGIGSTNIAFRQK